MTLLDHSAMRPTTPYRFHALFAAFGDKFGREVGQLLQVRVFAPHALRHHLRQFHGSQSRRQPTVRLICEGRDTVKTRQYKSHSPVLAALFVSYTLRQMLVNMTCS